MIKKTFIINCLIIINLIVFFTKESIFNAADVIYNQEKSKFNLTSTPLDKLNDYKRKAFKYYSYSTNTIIGFYTNKKCLTNIDHVVSLKDAYVSGAYKWDKGLKKKFANDKSNHVPACIKINSSKGASIPKDFLRKSRDGKGLDYQIVNMCSYLRKYFLTKEKYNLSFEKNSVKLFKKCKINIY